MEQFLSFAINIKSSVKRYTKKMIKLLMVAALIAIVSGSAIIDSEDGVEGVLINREYHTTRAVRSLVLSDIEEAAPHTCPAGAKGNICANDCKTLLGCSIGNTTPLTQNLCDSLSSNSPYCIPGRMGCSATGNISIEACAKGTPLFLCTNTGYFPDPLNCTKYNICSDGGVDTYACPPNYVYDGVNSKCKLKRVSADCVTVNCAASPNKYIVYSANKAYYAFCKFSAGISNPIMFRCEDTANFQFNTAIVNCEFACKAEGWYPYNNNCQKYYECYKSGTQLLSRIQTCPSTTIFDATKSTCINGTCPTEAPLEIVT